MTSTSGIRSISTRPQLNLTGAYGLSGLGGPILLNGGAGTIPSGYFDSLRNILQLDAPTWTLGFSFAYPLGQSAQEANVARAKLSIDQSNAQLKALELQIATDVTNAALTVQSSLESVQASGVARELAQKKLEAAQSKFEVGMATNYEVVQAQRDFADAQNVELRSILTYRKALVNFDAVQTVSTSRGVASAVSSAGGTGTTGTGTTGTTTGTGSRRELAARAERVAPARVESAARAGPAAACKQWRVVRTGASELTQP